MRRDSSRLLKIVGGRPHASQNDHHNEISPSPAPQSAKAPPFRVPPPLIPDITAGKKGSDVVRDEPKLREPSATILNNTAESPDKDVNRDPDSSDPEEEDISSMRRPGATVYVPEHLKIREVSRNKRKGGTDNIHTRTEGTSPKRSKLTECKDQQEGPKGWRPSPKWPNDENEHFASRKKPVKTFGRAGGIPPAKPFVSRKPTSAVLLNNRTGRPEQPKSRHAAQLPTPSSTASKSASHLSDDSFDSADDFLDLNEQPESEAKSEETSEASRNPNSSAAAKSSQEVPKLRYFSSLTQYESNLPAEKIEEIEQERKAKEEREKEETTTARRKPSEGPCPMQCGKMLKMSVLDGLNEKATFKEQQRFCRKHRVEDAAVAWKDRGYPKKQNRPYIDWQGFAQRLTSYDTSIQTFFKKPNNLHFRKKMAERIKSGKSRTLLQQMKNEGFDTLGAGYYGTKGHDLMTNHISRTFTKELRDQAAKDTVMSAQGAMAYVQEVLVLELASMLIMDDRNCNVIEARKVMAESSEIGDLLWPSESSESDDGKRKGRSSRFNADD